MSNEILQIDCGDTLTIKHVSEFYVTLLAALAEAQPVHLNISGLERLDMAGVQLLYALAEDADDLPEQQISWSQASPALADACETLGIDIIGP